MFGLYRCRLSSLSNSSLWGVATTGAGRPELQLLRRDFIFSCQLYYFHFTLLFLPFSSMYLSYFIIAVPVRKCSGKHSCMSSRFPIWHTECSFFFYGEAKRSLLWPKLRLSKLNNYNNSFTAFSFQTFSAFSPIKVVRPSWWLGPIYPRVYTPGRRE